MILYLADMIQKSRQGDQAFFRMAHMWKFGRDLTGTSDVVEYRKNQTIPKYVADYIDHIQHVRKGGNDDQV